jgi:hypothetical protein
MDNLGGDGQGTLMDGKINTAHSIYMANFYNISIVILQLLHTNALEHIS